MISVVSTVKNEIEDIDVWLEYLLFQTKKPDEIIIVDGGSTDGTWELLQKTSLKYPYLKVYSFPEANIAKGRNLAIEKSKGEIIAVTDGGCFLTPTWLENLIRPFEENPGTGIVGGGYGYCGKTLFAAYLASRMDHGSAKSTSLVSSRSIAFRKELWKQVGGYPEWLTLAGEDTLFFLMLQSLKPVIYYSNIKDVSWKLPNTFTQYFRMKSRYALGDGEFNRDSKKFYRRLLRIIVYSIVVLSGIAGLYVYIPSLLGLSFIAIILYMLIISFQMRRLGRTPFNLAPFRTLKELRYPMWFNILCKKADFGAFMIGYGQGRFLGARR